MVSGEKLNNAKGNTSGSVWLVWTLAEYVIWIVTVTVALIKQVWLSLEALLAPLATHRIKDYFSRTVSSAAASSERSWCYSLVMSALCCRGWRKLLMASAELICGASSWGLLSLSIFFTHNIIIFWESLSCLAMGSGCAYPSCWVGGKTVGQLLACLQYQPQGPWNSLEIDYVALCGS